jgi:hypothetical protein
MRWLKRALWLLAWSFWLWLGFGLHRELPRELGPPVAQLPIKSPQQLSFVGGSNIIMALGSYPHSKALTLYDAETGRSIGERDSQPDFDLAVDASQSLRFGVWLKRFRNDPHEPGFQCGLERIDVLTNERKRLSNRDFSNANLHGEKPWLIAVEPNDGGERIRVLNINSGEKLCCINVGQEHTINSTPFFLPDGKRIVMPITRKPGAPTLEIWTVAKPSVMEASQPHHALQRLSSVSNNGRFARMHRSEYDRVEVVDLYSGRVDFTTPADLPGTQRRSGNADMAPVISGDGRTLFDFAAAAFWNVETGNAIWRAGKHEFVASTMEGHVSVIENWTQWWRSTPTGLGKFTTTAFREYETGRMSFRVRGHRMPQFLNASGTLTADVFGNVYRWPPPVNGPLLAACQIILALPLVLLWSLLWWRRRRLRRGAREAVEVSR